MKIIYIITQGTVNDRHRKPREIYSQYFFISICAHQIAALSSHFVRYDECYWALKNC